MQKSRQQIHQQPSGGGAGLERSPRRLGSTSFQSNEVSGAQKSEFLLLFSKHSRRVSVSLTCGRQTHKSDILPPQVSYPPAFLPPQVSYPPDPEVVAAGGQQIRVNPLGVGDPHDLGGGVRMVEGIPADELGALLLQTDQLDLDQSNQSKRPEAQIFTRLRNSLGYIQRWDFPGKLNSYYTIPRICLFTCIFTVKQQVNTKVLQLASEL